MHILCRRPRPSSSFTPAVIAQRYSLGDMGRGLPARLLTYAPVAVSVAVKRGEARGGVVAFLQGWLIGDVRCPVATPIRTAGPFAARGTERGAAAIAQAREVCNHARRSSRPRPSPSPGSLRGVESGAAWRRLVCQRDSSSGFIGVPRVRRRPSGSGRVRPARGRMPGPRAGRPLAARVAAPLKP
jgi:hypothetical protein